MKAQYDLQSNTLQEIEGPATADNRHGNKWACDDSCKEYGWADGQVLTENVDYVVNECDMCDGVGSVEGGKQFIETTCEYCQGKGVFAIPVPLGTAEKAKIAGRWLRIISQVQAFFADNNKRFGALGDLIDQLESEYPLSKLPPK
jgi:hypothetical protein